ncbi:MAG: SOS response-associated peptidase [Anaerocolumna sp.]
MCGRYYVDDETSREIRKILEQIDAKCERKTLSHPNIQGSTAGWTAECNGSKYENNKRSYGEIFPTNSAPMLAAFHEKIEPELSIWGFPNYYNKGVLINARAETVLDKKTFRESVFSRRCVIPSNGFYEWDRNKKKILFKKEESDVLYMAGIYNFYQEECRFVILTTQANESMAEVHNRMPVVLKRDDMEKWILDNNSISRILQQIPPLLTRTA